MSNDFNKLNFDPIPVTGTPRPELPKVPELPSLKATKPVEAPATPAPVATSWLPDSVWQLFQPTRTKGVLAAGVISLLGGAATMRYVWPPKPTTTAQVEPEQPAPLPAATNGTIVLPSPVQTPTVPMVATVEPPTISLPSLTAPTVSSSVAFPTPTFVHAATTPAIVKLELPDILPVTGTLPTVPPPATLPAIAPLPVPTAPVAVAPASAPLTLTDITGAGGSVPPTLPSLALPTIPGLTLPATNPTPEIQLTLPTPTAIAPTAVLPLPGVPALAAPEIRIEQPRVDAPPSARIPVPGATVAPAKPLEIGLPNIELAPPTLDLKPLPTSPPALELPVVGAPSFTPQPALVATSAKTDYDVDLHYVKSGDSWAAVSKQHYGDDRYAEALKGYNQNATLAQLQRAEVPPIHILRKNYPTAIGKPVEISTDWTKIAPTGATELKRGLTGGGYKTYVIPAGGRTIKEIAADAYGDESRWGVVWESNPKLVPDKSIPEGTKIYLTSQAKIGE